MRMALSTVNQNEYGVVLSRVIEVSNFAVSQTAILNEIQNADLFRLLSAQQPVIKVIAEPIFYPNDPSTFAWTSKKGPPIELTQGLVGKVSVTVEKIHPIYYLVPLKSFKKTSLGKSL